MYCKVEIKKSGKEKPVYRKYFVIRFKFLVLKKYLCGDKNKV